MNIYQKFEKSFLQDPPKVLVTGFVLIILLGAYLLQMPFALQEGKSLSFLDALFTATSATCVTGLVITDTGTTFSREGHLIILGLIQIGGLGFMTFAIFFSILIGKKIGIKEKILLKESLNQTSLQGIIKLAKRVLLFTVIIEFIGFVSFSLRFMVDMPVKQALFYGMFHSVSMFNNAGFDIMGSISGEYSSFVSYVGDPVINITIMLLIILGGIGFLVIGEMVEKRKFRSYSLHTKLVLFMTIFLILFGTLFILLLEWSNTKTMGNLSVGDKVLSAFFQSISPRTAGANTLNLNDLRLGSVFIIVALMFIGAAPGSTGGGIKVTTFVTLILAVWSHIKGNEEIVVAHRTLTKETVYKAMTVIVCGMMVVNIGIILLTITEPKQEFLPIMFEVVSAFGTVGLTLGVTPELSGAGKIIILTIMFIGRLGLLTLVFALAGKQGKTGAKYPSGRILIG